MLYECLVIKFLLVSSSLWITPTLLPSLERPAAGPWASLCLPFVMRCHLCSSGCAQACSSLLMMLRMTMTTLLLLHLCLLDRGVHPQYIFLMLSRLPLVLRFSATPLASREQIHINEGDLCVCVCVYFLHLLVVL